MKGMKGRKESGGVRSRTDMTSTPKEGGGVKKYPVFCGQTVYLLRTERGLGVTNPETERTSYMDGP